MDIKSQSTIDENKLSILLNRTKETMKSKRAKYNTIYITDLNELHASRQNVGNDDYKHDDPLSCINLYILPNDTDR